MVESADTLVLEASTERCESSSLSWGTSLWVIGVIGNTWVSKTLVLGSSPRWPAKLFKIIDFYLITVYNS